jgi:hypothetical protein
MSTPDLPVRYSAADFSSLLRNALLSSDWAALQDLIGAAQRLPNTRELANQIHQLFFFNMFRDAEIRRRVSPANYQSVADVLGEELHLSRHNDVRSVLFSIYPNLLFRMRQHWIDHDGVLSFDRELHGQLFDLCVEDVNKRGSFPATLILKAYLHHLDKSYIDCAAALQAAVLSESVRLEEIRSYNWGAYTYVPPSNEYVSIMERRHDPSAVISYIQKPTRSSGLTIVFSVDSAYFVRYSEQLVASLAKFGEQQAHFHIVNPSGAETQKLAELGKRYENVGISASKSEGLPERHYYATARMLLSFALLTSLESDIAILDADIEFKRSPDQIFAPFRGDDAAFIVQNGYPSQVPWRSVTAQAFYLGNCAGGRAIAKWLAHAAELLLSCGTVPPRRRWWIDQNLLHFTYKALDRKGYRIGRIPTSVISDIGHH